MLIGVAAAVASALPVLGLRLGFSDEGNYPEDTTTRQAYDLLADGFGPGFNGPLSLATEVPSGTDPAAVQAITDAIGADSGVAFVSDPIINDDTAPTAALWRVVPTTAPQDAETTDLVNRLRDDVLPAPPPAPASTSPSPEASPSASTSPTTCPLATHFLRRCAGAVVPSADGRVPVPAGSAQSGDGRPCCRSAPPTAWSSPSSSGVGAAGCSNIEGAPIEPFIPMMLFAIVFGLSMDYEVFLLSRVREEWDRTGDSRLSVADGLASTARVITAAAAIMVVVFGSFLGESDRVVKLFGLGLSVAVLIDATIVRLLLVPATMELLGDRNWWIPRWLDRILPKVHIEAPPDLDAELAELDRETQVPTSH